MRVSRFWLIVLAVLMAVSLVCAVKFRTQAADASTYEYPTIIRCTCYCDTGITASGQYTRRGIVAGKREWIGKVAVLYAIDPETGGDR